MKNNLFKFLIGIIIVIIIILLILILVLSRNIIQGEESLGDEGVVNWSDEISRVNNKTIFYTIENCINNYLSYCNVKELERDGSFYLDEAVGGEDMLEYAYDVLDKNFIRENSINEENIKDKIKIYNEDVAFKAKKMNEITGQYIKMYAVYGEILDENNNILENVYFRVYIDEEKGTFSIEPLDSYNSIDEIGLTNSSERIEENENNSFEYIRLSDSDLLQKYLEDYKMLINSDIEEAYNLLEEAYRNVKFPTLEDFKQYINVNKDEILNSVISRYSVSEGDNYNQYICLDRNEKYFIFNEKCTMDYTIMLDYYTIGFDEFVKKYNDETIENRCAMNIEKIRQALNNADYKYLYSKLADSFKSNYFNNEEDFENYVKNNFYKKNAIEYINVDNQNNSYIFTVSITNIDDSSAKPIEKTIVVQLKEGTDFVFSFSV